MELSPRLRSVAGLVPPGARFADVGTDHAYLPVWLLQQGIIEHALVSDLRPGPLDRARSTAARYGLAERMEFRLCDGLSGIAPAEARRKPAWSGAVPLRPGQPGLPSGSNIPAATGPPFPCSAVRPTARRE